MISLIRPRSVKNNFQIKKMMKDWTWEAICSFKSSISSPWTFLLYSSSSLSVSIFRSRSTRTIVASSTSFRNLWSSSSKSFLWELLKFTCYINNNSGEWGSCEFTKMFIHFLKSNSDSEMNVVFSYIYNLGWKIVNSKATLSIFIWTWLFHQICFSAVQCLI